MVQEGWDFVETKYGDAFFEKWWDVCPKKAGKPRAYLLWKRLRLSEGPTVLEQVLSWTSQYRKKTRAEATEDKFILHPATILSQRRWEDKIREEDKETPAEKDWKALISYISRYGINSDVPLPLSERGLEVLRKMGGRRKIGLATSWENEHKNKKHFTCAYNKDVA